MNSNTCEMYDEYNACCMWNRIEKIFKYSWEETINACFEEMP